MERGRKNKGLEMRRKLEIQSGRRANERTETGRGEGESGRQRERNKFPAISTLILVSGALFR